MVTKEELKKFAVAIDAQIENVAPMEIVKEVREARYTIMLRGSELEFHIDNGVCTTKVSGPPGEWSIDQRPDDGNLLTRLSRDNLTGNVEFAVWGPPAGYDGDRIKLYPYSDQPHHRDEHLLSEMEPLNHYREARSEVCDTNLRAINRVVEDQS